MSNPLVLRKNGSFAWLLQSTFGFEPIYDLPRNVCSAFWLTAIAVLFFPFTIIGHFVNIILIRKYNESPPSVLPTTACLLFALISGGITITIAECFVGTIFIVGSFFEILCLLLTIGTLGLIPLSFLLYLLVLLLKTEPVISTLDSTLDFVYDSILTIITKLKKILKCREINWQ